MQCETCHSQTATVHLTQVTEEGVRKLHLCEECAQNAGIDLDDAASIADALLVGWGEKKSAPADTDECPECHLKASDFKRTGRLGCPHCYTAWRERLRPLIRSTHRAERHRGKKPRQSPSSADIGREAEALRNALSEAVAREAFEEAARLRDRLRDLGSGFDRAEDAGGEAPS